MKITSHISLTKEDVPGNVFHVFVSIPMAGLGDEDVKKEQTKCFKDFCDNNPKIAAAMKCKMLETIAHAGGPLASLGVSLIYMHDADVVVFHPNWNTARGCQIEHLVAEKYNKMIYYAKI